jgi:prophage maintenance system killer protein
MKVELTSEEAWVLLSEVARNVLEDAGLNEDDRSALRRWRSEEMRPNAEPMVELTAKLNVDLAKTHENKSRSRLRKPDWK